MNQNKYYHKLVLYNHYLILKMINIDFLINKEDLFFIQNFYQYNDINDINFYLFI